MFNIKYKGKYKDESQLKKGALQPNAVIFKEPNSISGAFLKGALISSPIIVVITIALVLKIGSIKNFTLNIVFLATMLSFILSFFHEVIHAVCFPKEAEKEIWTKFNEGALFVYCSEPLPKKKFIWMCFAPNLILGYIPFILFIIGIFDFNRSISNLVGISSWIMIVSGIGDYLNIYNTIKQVPKNADVFNYGFHSYWVKK